MHAILQDLQFATRQLRRAPGFTLTALLTLMLAIGATTAMVSVLRATLLNPTPYPGAAQLVGIDDIDLQGRKAAQYLVTVARAADLGTAPGENGKPLFSASTFFYFDQPTLRIDGHAPLATAAVAASGDFFRTLGTAPLLGRPFTPADDAQGAPETAVISYGLWQRVFAADPGIAGRSVLLAGKPTTIVGVMPPHFAYPAQVELWKPGHLSPQQFSGYRGEGTRFVHVLARLADSQTTLGQAQASLDLLASRLAHRYTATDAEFGFRATALRTEILGSYREGLVLVSSAVGILLLIACANVAGLQLSRNASRQPEMALRRALGVSSARLVRQLLTESLLLLITGAALGVVLASGLLRILAARLPETLISFATPHLDLPTLFATMTVAFTVGIFCALGPCVQFGRAPANITTHHNRTVAGSTRRFGRSFASLQIALALVLLTLAASLLQSLYHLLETPLGYEASHLVTLSVHLPFGSDPLQTHRFYQQFESRIAALPGVSSVGAIDALPLSSFTVHRTTDILGRPLTPHHDTVSAEGRSITPAYLATMRIPLLAGRDFTDRDGETKAPAVVLVNQSFAAKYFPQESPLGKRLVVALAPGQPEGTIEIVGVLGDVHGTGGELGSPVGPELYQPEQGYWPDMHYVVRTTLPAGALEPALRQQLASVDPGAALGTVADFTSLLDHALAQPRLNSGLLSALAGLALLLVLIGVYGVVAFSVAQRTRELAVRLALGSSRKAIFAMLLREATGMLAAGLLLGVAGAATALRLLAAAFGPQSLSSGNSLTGSHLASAAEPLLLVSALLACAVIAASLLPARRAASIDPMQALRSE